MNHELQQKVAELTGRVDALSAALLDLLTDREEQAMLKAATMFKRPRDKAVDIIGYTVRPWLSVAGASVAREVRAMALDAVVGDLQRALVGTSGRGYPDLASTVRQHGITWEEIGVAPDGSVDPGARAELTMGKAGAR